MLLIQFHYMCITHVHYITCFGLQKVSVLKKVLFTSLFEVNMPKYNIYPNPDPDGTAE